MQINTSQSSTVNPFGSSPTPSAPAVKPSADQENQAAASSADSVSSQSTDKLKSIVQNLLSQSDIRPEVVEKHSSDAPAAQPTDAQMRSFVKALRTEV